MNRSQGGFAGVVVLAIVWTGWLAYMAKTVAKPFVVSAPQLHSANLVSLRKSLSKGIQPRQRSSRH